MTFAQRLAARRSALGDGERGSIPMLMLVMLCTVGVGALLLNIVVGQTKSSTFNQSRATSLQAAQSGIDVALGQLRTAVSSVDSTKGLTAALPCAPVQGLMGTSGYYVTISYYNADPDTLTNSDLTTLASAGGQLMTCVAGQGTYFGGSGQSSANVTPQFARLVAIGCANGFATNSTTCASRADTSTKRTVTSTYDFQVNNVNISGGELRIYPSDDETQTYCADAGSPQPAEGSPVSLQRCSGTTPIAPQQRFAYRPNLTMQLVSSITSQYPKGLCLQVSLTRTDSNNITIPDDTAATNHVVMKPCDDAKTPLWSQVWSFDDHSSFQAARSDSATTGTLSGQCMGGAAADHTTAPNIDVIDCRGSINDPQTSWLPNPAVGAGNAVSDPEATKTSVQWINFQQFGRCINQPGSQPQIDFIIVAGCKQNPYRAKVSKNQFLTYDPSSKQMVMTLSGKDYCLYSQSAANGTTTQLVLLTPCDTHPNVTSAAMTWTRTTPKTSPKTPSNQQYRLIDANGQCMSVANVKVDDDTNPFLGTYNGKDYYAGSDYSQWSKLVTQPCAVTSAQQWNAASTTQNSSLNNITEGN